MRLSTITAISGAFIAAFSGSAQAASSYGRAYGFGFRNGNLVRNWSFESLGDNWFDESGTTSRFLAKRDGIAAVSGSYVAKHYSPTNMGSSYRRVTGEFIPVEPGVAYTFSCYAKTSGNTSGTHPYLAYFLDRSGTGGSANGTAPGPNYPVNTDWTLVSFQFTPPAGTEYVQLSLLEIPTGEGGTFYFDDVVIESGVATASNRDSITETVSFLNDAGQALQTQEKIKGGDYTSPRAYLVQSDSVDYQLRSLRNYTPYVRTGLPDFDAGFPANAKAYASPSNGRDTLQDFPYSSTEYSESLARPIASSSMPGEAWNPWDGTRKMRSGSYFTNSLTAPNFPATEVVNDAELPYLYSWSKSVEGNYSLTWRNGQGQVIQTAVKPNTTWLYTRYEYFPDGRLKKVLQDSDVPGDDTHQDFRQVTNYNSAGEVTSTYTKDKGLRKFWYNRLGQLRFSRHESQPADTYDYTSYDSNDRPYSMGVQVIPNLSSTQVEQRDTPSGKTEHKGLIYDNLVQFQSRTGILLSDIMPRQTLAVNGEGRLVCEYNLNNEVSLPSSFTAKDRLVATFYNYNAYGEITDAYKYIGSVRDINKRIHRVVYFYDNNHRLYQTQMEDNGSTPLTTYQHYDFDELGRIVKVTGASGKFYSSYKYYDWGGLKSVVLGGTGNSTSGTRMDFTYHAQGWIKEIWATQQSSNAIVFQQFLGYEAQAVPTSNIPAVAPKYDGSITQQLIKFANDLDDLNPIRVTNYQYDSLDRMLVADTRKNSGTPPWGANQQIVFSSLNLMDTDDQDSRLSYDNIGRIATNRSGAASADAATYSYQGNSYKLDHVTGKLNPDTQRDASANGTFSYDARGRMTADISKNMTVTYGWDDMPTQFDIQTGDTLISDRELYDAQGTRVCRVKVKTQTMTWVPIFDGETTIFVKGYINQDALAPKMVQSITDVNLLNSGDRRWVETYDDAGAIIASNGKSGVFGASGQIGELNSDGVYRYFVKNHLGSIMRTVGENGELDGSATDYLAYGSQKKLKMGLEEQVQSFTGKEQEDATGEYAFGARWYDPELAIFLGIDPVNQYANPYAYGPGSPMSGSDPTGMSWDFLTPILPWEPFGSGLYRDFYETAGDAKDATIRETRQSFNDFHSWAGGYGRGDEDNIFRQMYRSMTGGSGVLNCGSDRGEGGCWDEPGENQGGIGVGITLGDGGWSGYVADGSGRPILPFRLPSEPVVTADDAAGEIFTEPDPKKLSKKALVEYELIKQGAKQFWEKHMWSDMKAALIQYGNKEEIGFIYSGSGKRLSGPYFGYFNEEKGVHTLGDEFSMNLKLGNKWSHSHPWNYMRAHGAPGTLSENDFILALNYPAYGYETSNGRLHYSDRDVIEIAANSYLPLANMYLGTYPYPIRSK